MKENHEDVLDITSYDSHGKIVPPGVKTLGCMSVHCLSEIMCVICFKRTQGVYPKGLWLIDMECPGCLAKGSMIKTGCERASGCGDMDTVSK